MLLRIIDKPTASAESDLVEVQFTHDAYQKSYTADYFPSPFSNGLKTSLSWYFSDYLQQPEGSLADRDVVTKVLQLGQQMADNLLGEEHQLMSITEQIADVGINDLQVEFVSSRLAFFDELWESVILPESSFMLSGATASFTRRFEPSVNAEVLQLEHSAEKPVECLTLFDECADVLPELQQMHIESFGFHQVLKHSFSSISQIQHLPITTSVGIVHLTSSIQFLGDGTFLLRGSDIAESQLLNFFTCWKTQLVIVSSDFYSVDEQKLDASIGLAWLAQRLLFAGVTNVIGLSQYADSWVIQQNVSAVLQALVQGVSVSRAVVEARKSLQRNNQSQVFTNQGVPFQSWSLLQHYQTQDTRFISQGVEVEAAEQSALYNELRRSMHGFVSENIFPTAFPVTDANLSRVIPQVQTHAKCLLKGASGSGKTYALHQIATWYLATYLQNNPDKIPEQSLDLTGAEQAPKALPETQAFYFDFSQHSYSEKDLTDMIAPTVGIDPRGESMSMSAVWDKLQGTRSLLVFDNVSQADEKLLGFIDSLVSHELKVVLASSDQPTNDLDFNAVELRPLSDDVMRTLVAHQLRLSGLSQLIDLEVLKLVDACRGNPFLVVNLAKQLRNKADKEQSGKSAQALVKQVTENIDWSNSGTPLVQQYLHWQWHKLPAVSQAWLGLLSEIPDVLLEMFGIVAGRSTPDFVELVKTLNAGAEPDESQLDFGQCLQHFVAAGFATRYPHGRMLRKSTLSFVRCASQEHIVLVESKDELTVLLAKVIAASLLKLLPQIQRKPDQQIVQTLLAHRDIWARQLEVLWAAEQYGYFLGLTQQLTAFLNGYQLGQEMTAWSAKLLLAKQIKHIQFDTLQRVDDAFSSVNQTDERKGRLAMERLVAQATLANQAAEQLGEQAIITDGEAKELSIVFEKMVLAWEEALTSFIDPSEQKWAVLAQHGLQMLVNWYRRTKDWQKLHSAAKTCQQIYQQYEAWPRVITATQQMLEACVYLKDASGVADAEKLILRDVPYDKFPPGTFLQNAMQIVIGRVGRKEDSTAQTLVDELKALPDSKPLSALLDAVQADIHLLRDEYSDALKLLFMQWDELVKQAEIEAGMQQGFVEPQGQNAEMLKMKLLEIKQKVGEPTYVQISHDLGLDNLPQ